MRILFLNFEFGMSATKGLWQMPLFWRYLDYRNVIKKVGDFIKEHGVDVAGFVEVNFPKQPEVFKEVTGMNAFGETVYQNRLIRFIRQGNLLLSRYPIREFSMVPLPGAGQPRAVVKADLETSHGAVTVLLTHLGLGKRSRRLQINALNSLCAGIKNPFVLMGDFNSFDLDELQPLLSNGYCNMRTRNRHTPVGIRKNASITFLCRGISKCKALRWNAETDFQTTLRSLQKFHSKCSSPRKTTRNTRGRITWWRRCATTESRKGA